MNAATFDAILSARNVKHFVLHHEGMANTAYFTIADGIGAILRIVNEDGEPCYGGEDGACMTVAAARTEWKARVASGYVRND